MSDPLDKVFAGVDFPGKRPLRDLGAVAAPSKLVAIDDEWDDRPIIKNVHGVPTEFFTIGNLARALGRKTVTVRSWEAKGWLPNSTYRTRRPRSEQVPGKEVQGRRLYLRVQIEIVVAAARECGVLHDNARNAEWRRFTVLVLDGWKKLS